MGLNYISLPLVLNFLGESNYGVWITIFSIVNWINNFDVGIGNGLKNKLTETLTLNKREEARSYITTAYILIISITMLFIVVGISGIYYFKLGTVFNVKFISESHLKTFVITLFILTLSNFVIGLYKQMFYAVHESSIVAFTKFLYQVLIIIFILIAKQYTSNSLVLLSLIYGGANLIIGLIYSFLFFYKRKYLIPSIKYFKINKIRDIMGIGLEFFIIQMAMIVIFTTDNVIISKLIGVEAVTSYNIILKIFQVFIFGFGILLVPFWALYTKAYFNKDKKWILKTIKRFNILFIISIFGIFGAVYFIDVILKIWLGRKLNYPRYLPLFCGIFAMIKIYADIFAIFVNGVGKLKMQLLGMIIGAVINIPLSIYFVKIGLNSSGVILASIVSMFIVTSFIVIHSFFIIKKLNFQEETLNVVKKNSF